MVYDRYQVLRMLAMCSKADDFAHIKLLKCVAFCIGLVLSPIPAIAKAVYLTCDFTYEGKPQPRKFTLDEDRGTASIFYPETAESQTLAAQFSDGAVMFETYVDRYGINRSSLVGVRQAKLDGAIDKAQCRIETPATRAF